MEFFLNPWYMAAGGALVSSPVVIHLINRMRFKRLRWAAMEFLLKSQKRNRRRLIIEQLILLLLRILIVLMVALVVARWIYGGDSSATGTAHMVVIDDTLSMRDRWKDNAGEHSAWSVAREQVMLLAKNAALANSIQEMRIVLLSDLEHPIFDERLSDKSEEQIGKLLDEKKATFLHISPLPGLEEGYKYLHAAPQGQKVLHFVSDFRESDWDSGPDVAKIDQKIASIRTDQINVILIDTAADPSRSQTRSGTPKCHDNIAIIDFRPNSRVVAENSDVVFTVTLFNFGKSERQDVTLDIYVDGKERYEGHKQFARIQSQQRIEEKVTLSFQKVKNGPEYARVRAQIKTNDSPLAEDDVRDVVVDLRKRVPILIIDGTGTAGPDDPQYDIGDFRTLNAALAAGKAYEPKRETVDALEKLELYDFPTIYLLDVPPITNEVVLDKLQKYTEKGGNLVYFLGPKTQASFLNDLHYKRAGLFPVPLQPKPVDTLSVLLDTEGRRDQLIAWIKKNEGKETPTEDDLKRLMRRIWIQGWDPLEEKQDENRPPRILQGKILFRDKDHPFVSKESNGLATPPLGPMDFDNLLISYYYEPKGRSEWQVPEQEVVEVVTMPQIRSSIAQFKKEAQELRQTVQDKADALGATDSDYAKQKALIPFYRKKIREALDHDSLAMLDQALEHMLEDAGDERNPDRPDMPKLWGHPQMKSTKENIVRLRDKVRYGDGLVYARKYVGRDDKNKRGGYTVAVLTTAGTSSSEKNNIPKWNEWGDGPAKWSYPNFVRPMQTFLNSQGDSLNRVLDPREKFETSFEKNRYKPDVKVTFTPQEQPKVEDGKPVPPAKPKDLPTRKLESKDDRQWLTFAEAKEPGIYNFELMPERGSEADVLSLSYNVDAEAEGNLTRTETDKLEKKDLKDSKKGSLIVLGPGDSFERFKNREPDVSELPWIYVVLLLLLLAEQAMAVHLSFHLKSGEGTAAPSAPVRVAA